MGIGIKDEGSNGRRVIVFADRRVLRGTTDECCSASMHHGSIRLPLEWAGYRQSGPQEDTDDGPMVFDQIEIT